MGDPLERLSKGIDFELFRSGLTDKLHVEPKNKGGRRPYDYVLMFKVMILQRYYNISDEQAEYQICDRLSFMRFLGLTLADDVPDSKTIWSRSPDMDASGSGFVTILDKHNKVVSNIGGSEPTYVNGVLQSMRQTDKIFVHPHDVCIDKDKNIYMAQWASGKVYPYKLTRANT